MVSSFSVLDRARRMVDGTVHPDLHLEVLVPKERVGDQNYECTITVVGFV